MRRFLLMSVLLFGAPLAFSQTYGRFNDLSLQDAQGQAIAGAQVNISLQSSCGGPVTGPAILYSTALGPAATPPQNAPLSQPLLTDGYGHAVAYAAVACYTVTYNSPYTGLQTFIDQVPLSPSSGGGGGGSPGTPPNSVQYNNAGAFGGLPINARGALNSDGLGDVPTYVPPFAVSVMQAPYNAACNGTTDDHLAIQAALDNNPAVYIPHSTGGVTTCNIGTVGLTICSSSNLFGFNALYGNGGVLAYKGTGIAIQSPGTCNTTSVISDVSLDMSACTGTGCIGVSSLSPIHLVYLYDTSISGSGHFISVQVLDQQATINSSSMNGTLQADSFGTEVTDSIFDNLVVTRPRDVEVNSSLFNGPDASSITTASSGDAAINAVNISSTTFRDTLNVVEGVEPFQLSLTGDKLTSLSLTGTVGLTGNSQFVATGVPAITGSFTGSFTALDGNGNAYGYINGFLYSGVFYSVSGTPLPACTSSLKSVHTQVSDATLLSGPYVGSGSYTAPVYCGYNGSTYAWEMYAPTGGGGGAVSSVSNIDGTETISPTTGAVVASVNQAHTFTWTANHNHLNATSTWDVSSPSNPAVAVANTGITASTGTGQNTVYGPTSVTISTCASGTYVKADGSGCGTPSGGGVSQIVAGTGIGVSPGGGTGVVTVSSTAISTFPSNAVLLCTGDSWCDDDPTAGVFQNAPTLTISSWTTSGSSPNFIATVITSTAHNLAAANWVNMRNATGFTSFLPSGIALQTGVTLFSVLSGGLTTTQFEINTGTHNEGTCSSSCGTMETAMNNMPYKIAEQPGLPASVLANVVVSVPSPVTVQQVATGFSSVAGPWNPSTTGQPLYILVNSPWNDIGICSSVSTIETAYTSIFTQAHAFTNTKVILPTIPTNNVSQQFGAGFCTYPLPPYQEADELQRFLNGDGRSAATALTGAYWDIYANSGASLNDPEYPNQGQGSSTGWNLYASGIANALISGNGAPDPINIERWGNAANADSTAGNGYNWHPSADSNKTFQWQNSDYTSAMILETASDADILSVNGNGIFIDNSPSGSNGVVLQANETANNSSAANHPWIESYGTLMPTGTVPNWEFGHDQTTNDTIHMAFDYVGSGSTSNFMTLALRGTNGIKIDGSGNFYIPGIGSSTNPLCTTTGGQVVNNICTPVLANALTINNSGSGAASPVVYTGSAAQTISYNTVGAAAAPVNWTVETSSFSLAAGNGFIANASGGITASFPSSATAGFQSAICNVNTGTVTITSGTVTYVGPGTLAPTRCISFIYDGTDFRGTSQVAFSPSLTESDSGGIATVAVTNPAVSGTGTYTTATSDAFTVTGATSSSHCVFSPTNSTAAATTVLGYVSAVAANLVTISHAATVASGGTVNIVCTVN
jgi:hypothetical protein